MQTLKKLRKFFKILLITLGSVLGLLILLILGIWLYMGISSRATVKESQERQSGEVKILTMDGFTFRDLKSHPFQIPFPS